MHSILNADMDNLTGFQRDLLWVIVGLDDPHGLAIKDELDEYYEKDIYHGHLYPNLDTLVDKGFIEKEHADKRTNTYTVTLYGRRKLRIHQEWKTRSLDIIPDTTTTE